MWCAVILNKSHFFQKKKLVLVSVPQLQSSYIWVIEYVKPNRLALYQKHLSVQTMLRSLNEAQKHNHRTNQRTVCAALHMGKWLEQLPLTLCWKHRSFQQETDDAYYLSATISTHLNLTHFFKNNWQWVSVSLIHSHQYTTQCIILHIKREMKACICQISVMCHSKLARYCTTSNSHLIQKCV